MVKLTQREITAMTIEIAMKINENQLVIDNLKAISSRLGVISAVDPKDGFGDIITAAQIENHSIKAKAEFDKVFPPATK